MMETNQSGVMKTLLVVTAAFGVAFVGTLATHALVPAPALTESFVTAEKMGPAFKMDDWKTAFAKPWDAVILGTGFKECLLSGLLSKAGKKVLHLDRNPYYGGASASLNINQLFAKFNVEEKPSSTIGRQNDLYLVCLSGQHKVAPDGKYVVFVSTTVEGPIDGNESAEAVAHRELAAGLSLLAVGEPLREPLRIFYDMYDLMKPKEDGFRNRVFISESFDATTHFETAINDVLVLYERIMGEKLNLAAPEAQEIS